MSKHHELKTWTEFLEPIARGWKTFEVRKNDRDFKEGDTLMLMGWDKDRGIYTDQDIHCLVHFCLYGPAFGIEDGYVVMSIQVLDYNF